MVGFHSSPGSLLAWGDPALWAVVRLIAVFKRVYAKGDIPKLLLPVP